MGGYGAMRIGMKNPDVFSTVYLLSPCCMAPPNPARMQNASGPSPAEQIRDAAEIAKADFFTKAQLASAAAWAPNPKNPPLFIDLPTRNGEVQHTVLARFAANATLAVVDQYIDNLRKLTALGFDSGDQDGGITASVKVLHEVLTNYGLPHTSEVYPGNHISGVAERIETKLLPLLASSLSFEKD